jgi:preprotein translocase subunit SecF
MAIKFGNVEVFRHDMNYDFMAGRKLFVGISAFFVLLSIAVIAIKGLNYSIDFLGGAEVSILVKDKAIQREQIVEIAESAKAGKVEVTTFGAIGTKSETSSFLIRLQRAAGTAENETAQSAGIIVSTLKEKLGADKVEIGSVTNISGKIGGEEQQKGYMALLLSFLGILAYVAFRFDSRFAPGGVICLFHDVIIALGIMTALGKPFTVTSIAAFLTIIGYSINDTIIVYDRIREIQENSPKMPMVDVVNRSLNQTMNRTVLTSFTGLLALLVLTVFGGSAIEDFALTMFIGILVGSYSSIYVAAPLTLMMDDFFIKMGWKSKEPKQTAKVAKDPNFIPPVVLKKKPTVVTK